MSFYDEDTIKKNKQIICDPYEFLYDEAEIPKKKVTTKLLKTGKPILGNKTAKKGQNKV